MLGSHDPLRETRAFQQAITPGKMPVALLLGAGCPAALPVSENGVQVPLIPDVLGLTKDVQDELGKEKELASRLTKIYEQLRADGKEAPNIEDILSHIRALQQAAGSAEARGLSAKELGELDKKICELINTRVRRRLPGLGTPYHQVASWVGGITREHPVELFTTNYDLLMEQALEETGVPYFDGFVGSDRTFFDPASMELDELPARWARLWKLHGSINWRQGADHVVSRGESFQEGQRRVIHPSHLKYDESRRMPYLAMIDRLRTFLKRAPAVLITCGFSFSDQHLNEILHQELQGNSCAVCFALLFEDMDKYPMATTLARRRANLFLLARDAAIISTRRADWHPAPNADPASQPVAVEITPIEATESGTTEFKSVCKFVLGDFAKLGAFLAGEIGSSSDRGEPADAS